MNNRKRLGSWGEEQAAGYLADRGYQLKEQNFRTPHGEIDIICFNGDRTVFVEVKTRSSTRFGYPEESITGQKKAHMLAAAQFYLQQHPEMIGDWQIDVLAIERISQQEYPKITHFENVLSDPV